MKPSSKKERPSSSITMLNLIKQSMVNAKTRVTSQLIARLRVETT